MDKLLHPFKSVGWNYLSILELQRYGCSSFVMNKYSHSLLNQAYDYLSMLVLKLIHVGKIYMKYTWSNSKTHF